MFKFATAVIALIAASAQAATDDAYDYDHTELWADMPDSACAGLKNSPIALNTMDCTHYANYDLNLGDCTMGDMDFSVTKNGVLLVYKENSNCTKGHFEIPKDEIEGTYHHYNTHIHLSSEHTIDGKYFGAELHMVHLRSDMGRAAVLGTMVKPSSPVDNPTFERFLKKWQMAKELTDCACSDESFEVESDEGLIDVYENMRGKDFYHYDGGLTTPPCSEIVWWNFNTEPWVISVRQFQVMTDIILNTKVLDDEGNCKPITVASAGGSTSRPPQPLNGRVVDKICALS